MNTCHRYSANAVLCALLLSLLSPVAVAQSDSDSAMSSDAIKPDKALSPEQTDPLPDRSLGYSKRDKALSPEQTDPLPDRSVDYVKPDPALSPD